MPPDRSAAGRLNAIAGFRLVTADLPRLTRFYAETLGFTVHGEPRPIDAAEMTELELGDGGIRQTLRLGQHVVELDCFDQPGQPYPGGNAASPWFQHLAVVVTDMTEAYGRIAGTAAISRGGPQQLPPSSGGVTACKFRDPDGHPLELLEFPAGAAPAHWRGRRPDAGAIGLGIDHSAISVSDADASQAFYAPRGLSPDKRTHNEGPEQQRLDGLDDVQVDVVPLRPDAGTPHLELLAYGSPDEWGSLSLRANDVAATRIVWRSDAAGLQRDPDGHLLQLLTASEQQP